MSSVHSPFSFSSSHFLPSFFSVFSFLSDYVSVPKHLHPSHSPTITAVTLRWGASGPLHLTDRSWVATSPCGQPYQSPSLAELIGSLLFLAALLTFQSLECCVSECLSVHFADACIQRTSPVPTHTKNHSWVWEKTFSKLKWPNCHPLSQWIIGFFRFALSAQAESFKANSYSFSTLGQMK